MSTIYEKISYRIGRKIEVEKHYSGRYGAPGFKRQKKKKKTPEEMAKQNLWRKKKKLRQTIELNFGEGDWHVIITCRKKDRPTKEEAPKVIREFRDRLRSAYRQQDWELKYIITAEIGERGAVHWHMIINECHNDTTSTAKTINKLWHRGRCQFVPMDDTGDYEALANYIIKKTSEKLENGESIEKLSYIASRNLIRPEDVKQKETIRSNRWSKQPKPPKGWELIKLHNGINKFTGLPYQYYTIQKQGEEDSG